MKKILFLIISQIYFAVSPGQSFTVLPVPYKQHDLSIPHPAINGQATTLKAIARSSDPNAQFYYRWDADGDGDWDFLAGNAPVQGYWYRDNCYKLDGKFSLPYVDPAVTSHRIFTAKIEVAQSLDNYGNGIGSGFGSFPIIVFADVPSRANASSATDEQLSVMREIALDDALWQLHKQLVKSGTGGKIIGQLGQPVTPQSIAVTALFLNALVMNGHLPGYKAGTYSDYGYPLQQDQIDAFTLRWNRDPYSEDALRAMNFLLNNITISPLTSGVGFTYPHNELNEDAYAIIALAASGMGGTVAQVGNITEVAGKKIESIIQKFVDYIAYSQIKSGNDNGGWDYSSGASSEANSYNTGGRIMALMKAERSLGNLGVSVPQDVKDRLAYHLATFKNPDGGIPYTRVSSTSILEPVGLYIAGASYLGWNLYSATDNTPIGNIYLASLTKTQAKGIYEDYKRFIADRWNLVNSNPVSLPDLFGIWSDGNYNSGSQVHSFSYTMFNVNFGAINTFPTISNFTTTESNNVNWRKEFTVSSVRGQTADGYFKSASNYWLYMNLDVIGQTAMECVTLTPLIFNTPPVAIGHLSSRSVQAGCSGSENGKITFYQSASFHPDPSRQITDYQWIFDTDNAVADFSSINWNSIPDEGYSTDGRAFHSSNRDITPTYRYITPGSYNAALRVIDNDETPQSAIHLINEISVNPPAPQNPVVNSGGPYEINEGQMLTLYGTFTSYDLDCDPSATCEVSWDIDGDGDFDDFGFASGSIDWTLLSSMNIASNVAHNIYLRVKNSAGLMTSIQTTLTIRNIATGFEDHMSVKNKNRLYPNPGLTELVIEPIDEYDGDIRVETMNIHGRIVMSSKLKLAGGTLKVDIRDLEKGIYILRITGKDKSEQFRFIKE